VSARSGLRVSISAGLLAVLALVAGGVVAALVLLPGPVAGSSGTDALGGGSVTVTTEPYDGARQVSVLATVTDPEKLTITGSGRVTSSSCTPGASFVSGDVALVVDDRPIVALATATPLWRDLRSGARGDDVLALQTELARLGHDLTPDGEFGPGTREAVRAIQETAGVAKPDGALAAASVLWLPAPEVAVAECLLKVGDRADTGEIATAAGGLTALTVVDVPGAGWVLQHDDLAAPIDAEGRVDDATFLPAVAEGEPFRTARDDGSNRLTMTIALAEVIEVAVVPPSAVVASGDGTGCVQDDDGTVRAVEVVASSLGQTMVRFDDTTLPQAVRVRPDERVAC
jgi:hypothetical protein